MRRHELIRQALRWFFDAEDEDDEEVAEIKSAIEESLGQAERGRTVSLEEFDQRMRQVWHSA